MFNDLIGVPFKYDGMDCENLVKEVFKRYGAPVSDDCMARHSLTCYNLKQIAGKIEEGLENWNEIEKPEEPCLIAMSLGVPGFFNHVGVYIGDGKFIHTTRMRGAVTIERIDNPLFRNRRFYRFDPDNGHSKPV